MELRLFNTLTRSKERFEALHPDRVGIYTCGPTVYAEAHIGNLRSYLFPDVLKKLLRRLDYQVTHVINITDVGHLTSNEDTGEDKLEAAARTSARSAWDVAQEYTERFLADLAALQVDLPEHLPRATEHVPGQISLIEQLEAKGFTYRTSDGIYFNTARFADYGRLARLKVEGLQSRARVEAGEKRNKTDFALWKFCPSGVQRQMEWESPWGTGFPGWHIECSAMAMQYLGEQIDIHTGGTDHIPVHHTNEIAQSECATGTPYVHYWLHGEFLVLGDQERMGKSEGNMLGLRTLIERGYDPLAYRYLALNNHYRSYLSFSWHALDAATTALQGLRQIVFASGGEAAAPPVGSWQESAHSTALLEALCDDLNTPRGLAVLWGAMRDAALPAADKLALARSADSLLSLSLFDASQLPESREIPAEVQSLAEQRWQARQQKDFAESDRLRDEIASLGFIVRDRKDGFDVVPQ